MNTVAIIQSRMGSSRLPGKVLANIERAPMLARVVERVQRATTLDRVVVATSRAAIDTPVAWYCEDHGFDFFCGSQDDVLDRYLHAARLFGADVVVRLTADCPLLDAGVIDRVVRTFHSGRFDYVSNTLECTYPDGLDVEVFGLDALQRAADEARLASQREHVTPYIINHPELFCLGNVRHDKDLSHLRWTVDEPSDLEFVRQVYAECGPGPFGMADVLALLQRRPSLGDINGGRQRNEGYARSLEQDHLVGATE